MKRTIELNEDDFKNSPLRMSIKKELESLNIDIVLREYMGLGAYSYRQFLITTSDDNWDTVKRIFQKHVTKSVALHFSDEDLGVSAPHEVIWFSILNSYLITPVNQLCDSEKEIQKNLIKTEELLEDLRMAIKYWEPKT